MSLHPQLEATGFMTTTVRHLLTRVMTASEQMKFFQDHNTLAYTIFERWLHDCKRMFND